MHSTTAHYNYNSLCGVVHEICRTARSFDLRCESVTQAAVAIWYPCSYVHSLHIHIWLAIVSYVYR